MLVEGERGWKVWTPCSSICSFFVSFPHGKPASQFLTLEASFHAAVQGPFSMDCSNQSQSREVCLLSSCLFTSLEANSGPIYLIDTSWQLSGLMDEKQLNAWQSKAQYEGLLKIFMTKLNCSQGNFLFLIPFLTWQPISISVTWDFEEVILQSFPSFPGLAKNLAIPPGIKLKQLRHTLCVWCVCVWGLTVD